MINDDRIIRDIRQEMRWAGSDGRVNVPVAVLEHLLHHIERLHKRIELAERGTETLARYSEHMARRYGLAPREDV